MNAFYSLKLHQRSKMPSEWTRDIRTKVRQRQTEKKKKRTKERGGVEGWPVILSPSGTHMKHDGRMREGIFHCQSEGGMVIHFFLSQYISISLSTVSFPFCVLYNDNLIILHKVLACRGGGRRLSNQPIYRALPTDTEADRQKQQNKKSVKDF